MLCNARGPGFESSRSLKNLKTLQPKMLKRPPELARAVRFQARLRGSLLLSRFRIFVGARVWLCFSLPLQLLDLPASFIEATEFLFPSYGIYST